MELDKIVKVNFLKPTEHINTSQKIIETDIKLEDLLKLIDDVETKRGLGKSLHKEAFTGVDYLGNQVKFCSYVIWQLNENNPRQEDDKIWKYNFDQNWIPLNDEILRRDREEKINQIL